MENLSQHDDLTTARMADELPQDSGHTQAVQSADVVLLDIGFNDTPWNSVDDACDGDHGFFDGNPKAAWTALLGQCLQTELHRYHANLDKILTEIDSLRAGRPTAVLLSTQYSDFGSPPGNICCPPIATKVAAQVKVAFNKVECQVATAHHARCVDLLHASTAPTARPGRATSSAQTAPTPPQPDIARSPSSSKPPASPHPPRAMHPHASDRAARVLHSDPFGRCPSVTCMCRS